jgi:ABC-type nitrate/sulfonate/bicarbonate transport system permease component
MIASESGIAWMVIAATNRGATDVAMVGVLLMSAIALAVDMALRLLQTHLVPWTKHEQ